MISSLICATLGFSWDASDLTSESLSAASPLTGVFVSLCVLEGIAEHKHRSPVSCFEAVIAAVESLWPLLLFIVVTVYVMHGMVFVCVRVKKHTLFGSACLFL